MGYIKEYFAYSAMYLYSFLSTFIFQEQFRDIGVPRHKPLSFSMRVIYYLQENIDRNLTLQDLAGYFKYSESHFSALFLKETGTSPINYFIRLKIQKACQYIELTDMKLNEIALRLGFEEQAYFSGSLPKLWECRLLLTEKKRSVNKQSTPRKLDKELSRGILLLFTHSRQADFFCPFEQNVMSLFYRCGIA